jgi:hypothetical protein
MTDYKKVTKVALKPWVRIEWATDWHYSGEKVILYLREGLNVFN